MSYNLLRGHINHLQVSTERAKSPHETVGTMYAEDAAELLPELRSALDAAELLEDLLLCFTVKDGRMEYAYLETVSVGDVLGNEVQFKLVNYLCEHGLEIHLDEESVQ